VALDLRQLAGREQLLEGRRVRAIGENDED
jgi:hypothetical protein